MSTTTTRICDACNNVIHDRYIDASVYGVDIHVKCFNQLTPLSLVKLLGLDDVIYNDKSCTEKLTSKSYIP